MSDESPATLEILRQMIADLARRTDQRFSDLDQRLADLARSTDKRFEDLARSTAVGFEEMMKRLERVERTVKETRTDMREFRIELLGIRRKVAEHEEEIDLLKARAGAAG